VAIGLAIGHLLAPDSLTPAVAGTVVVFALLGGEFGPLFSHGTMLAVVKLLPSYWLVQASKVAAFGRGWPAEGWLVVAAWTAVMLGAAGLAYRRDTARI
jgi:ABC-2 type transport system permease protein